MLANACNIVIVRMQNVDYRNNRKLSGAVKDLFLVDKHRMFYRGLVPISIACANLQSVATMKDMFRSPDNLLTHYLWPFAFGLGCLVVHPFFVLGMRVQCAPFAPAAKYNNNVVNCFNYVLKTQGKIGFYRGFFPSLFLYGLISFPDIKDSTKDTIRATKAYL